MIQDGSKENALDGSLRNSRLRHWGPSLLGLYLGRRALKRNRSMLARLILLYTGGRLLRSGWRIFRSTASPEMISSESFQVNRELVLRGDPEKLFTHINQPEFIQTILETKEWPQLTPSLSEEDKRRWIRAITQDDISIEAEFAHETEGHSLCWKCLEPEGFEHTGSLDAIATEQPGTFRLRLNLIFTERDGGPRLNRHEIRSVDRFTKDCLDRLKHAYESGAFLMTPANEHFTSPNIEQSQSGEFRV